MKSTAPIRKSNFWTHIPISVSYTHLVMLPGGFSGGDEPDGSGKFIATTFRNPRLADAVAELLQKRDGLMLGICNGFQALIKLGLVPYGEDVYKRQTWKDCRRRNSPAPGTSFSQNPMPTWFMTKHSSRAKAFRSLPWNIFPASMISGRIPPPSASSC